MVPWCKAICNNGFVQKQKCQGFHDNATQPVGLRRFRPETTRRSALSQAGIVNFPHSSERMIASLKTLFHICFVPIILYPMQHIADMLVTFSNSQRLLVCDMIGKLVVQIAPCAAVSVFSRRF